MKTLSLVWGILAMVGMAVGFVPCFGALNWLVIPFSCIGIVIGVMAIATAEANEPRHACITGLAFCILAALLGWIRLSLGGGLI